jgi:hypothetical protein
MILIYIYTSQKSEKEYKDFLEGKKLDAANRLKKRLIDRKYNNPSTISKDAETENLLPTPITLKEEKAESHMISIASVIWKLLHIHPKLFTSKEQYIFIYKTISARMMEVLS